MNFSIDKRVIKAINILESGSFTAFCVGGCVRDLIMKNPPHDWDVTTSAMPLEIKECFKDFRTIDTGINHGTVTVIIDDLPIEITTFRIDGEYHDNRHPENVTFTSNIEDDLARRDFTINSIAYNPKHGIIDPFGGMNDIDNRIIRCVNDPNLRFKEDSLRILRCLRFASTLGFKIEENTLTAAKSNREMLKKISLERIQAELSKLICGKNAINVLRDSTEILFTILPELSPMKGCKQETKYHVFDVWEHTLHAMEGSAQRLNVRLALLFHDCGKPKMKTYGEDGTAHFYRHEKESAIIAQSVLERLRYPKRTVELIYQLIKLHGEHLPISEKRIKRILNKIGEDAFWDLIEVMTGDTLAHAPEFVPERLEKVKKSKELAKSIILENSCIKLKDLAINGKDLMEIGFPEGKSIGRVLDNLFNLVLDGKLQNERDILLKEAKRYKKL